MSALSTLAETAKAWPFEQARALLKRLENMERAGTPKEGPVTFETGYGPSGLPHIGTFGEVVRTTMVRHAFEVLTDGKYETRLICVSDDMDGMRKVPSNVPNPAKLEPFLQKPLTAVPDPFGTHDSYGAHMNSRLVGFLDSFGFQYEFRSATELYKSGAYDAALLRALEKFDEIMAVMLPTLGAERQATYSPFLPISPTTGRVLYVPMKATDAKAGTITFEDEDGSDVTLPVTGGNVKLQWKPDFGMRWAALGVDFEMFGKDHQDNAPIYSKICQILGARPPQQYVYELFLDEKGEKISKTRGNGISVEDWLAYAPQESLSLFQFQKPRAAKKLYFDVIPKAVDEYLTFLQKYPMQGVKEKLENPVWHLHSGNPPALEIPISYSMILNLVSAADAGDSETLWAYLRRYNELGEPGMLPLFDEMIECAIRYYEDFVKPTKVYRSPNEKERAALEELADQLSQVAEFRSRQMNSVSLSLSNGETVELLDIDTEPAGALQNLTFAIGKTHEFENLRDWFRALYEVLLGQSQGPRFGGFAALYGVDETAQLIRDALAR